MNLDERLRNVAILGAAGKMGSGISLLMAQEIARVSLLPANRPARHKLVLIDLNPEALDGLRTYIRTQSRKYAERMIIPLRELYADRKDLVENGDIIDEFVIHVESILQLETDSAAAKNAHMVFEAIVENADIKTKVYSALARECGPETFFFTNTSSIPIGLLDERSNLGGRLIGYHFYNPPAVQKLVELISAKQTRADIQQISYELAARLGKKIIPSHDIAGFIGNGHFMRDGLHAMAAARELIEHNGLTQIEALYAMNKISQDYLVRPMGIFQLMDYVGIDVFQLILKVMTQHIPGETLQDEWVDAMVMANVIGGQYADGSQKHGYLKYERGKPVAVFDIEAKEYVPFDPAGWTGKVDQLLGPLPAGHAPWKVLSRDNARESKLVNYFSQLAATDTLGAALARTYHIRSREIGLKLVADGVADQAEHVNGVLLNGFFHVFGPINDYLPASTGRDSE